VQLVRVLLDSICVMGPEPPKPTDVPREKSSFLFLTTARRRSSGHNMRLAIFALAFTALGALPALAASGACLKRGGPILQALTRQIRRANATASLAVHDYVLWACMKDRLQEYLRSSAVAHSGGQRLIVVIVASGLCF